MRDAVRDAVRGATWCKRSCTTPRSAVVQRNPLMVQVVQRGANVSAPTNGMSGAVVQQPYGVALAPIPRARTTRAGSLLRSTLRGSTEHGRGVWSKVLPDLSTRAGKERLIDRPDCRRPKSYRLQVAARSYQWR
jgi:hypothetical protein